MWLMSSMVHVLPTHGASPGPHASNESSAYTPQTATPPASRNAFNSLICAADGSHSQTQT